MFSIGLWSMLNAQWVSPGNGTTYDLDALVANSNGCVVYIGETPYSMGRPVYRIMADLTIAPTDQLFVPHYKYIEFDNVTLTIQGSMTVEGRVSDSASFFVKSHDNDEARPRIRFEDASDASRFEPCVFIALSGIKIINSEVTFNGCHFSYFDTDHQSSAVNFMNCDPIFDNCVFKFNEGAAIESGANITGSPQIMNCTFFGNVTANTNHPQINLGPGNTDTIRIVNNTVEGNGHDKSGGITIADLMGTGETKILLKDNIVKNNRYGYNQQGNSLSSTIIGNEFLDNNIETNPMNGGSGISVYGMNENNKAVLRNNIITGNLWGITAINAFNIDLGTEDEWGNNQIHDNGNSGVVYDLYNNSSYDIMAVGNDWGTIAEQEIEDHIVHQNDNPDLGLVTFIPYIGYENTKENTASSFEVSPNPVSNGSFSIRFEKPCPSEMVIYNLNGQIMTSQNIENEINIINTEKLVSGIYFVEICNENGKTMKKIVVR